MLTKIAVRLALVIYHFHEGTQPTNSVDVIHGAQVAPLALPTYAKYHWAHFPAFIVLDRYARCNDLRGCVPLTN